MKPDASTDFQAPRTELHALTGLRFFAAIHVVLYHTHGLIGADQPAWIIAMSAGGHHAVSLFFVLSGFILHHTYRHASWSTPSEYRNYLVNRFARIYPVYLLGFLVDAPRAVSYFTSTYDAATAALKVSVTGTAYLGLAQTWAPRLASAWNAPGWSLSNEAFFYLLLPWLLRRSSTLSTGRTVAGLLLTVAGASLGQALPRIAVTSLHLPTEVWFPFLGIFPPLRLFEFVFGLLLGRLFAVTPPPRRLDAIACAAGSWLALIVILVVSNPFSLPGLGRHHGLLLPFYGILIISLTQSSHGMARFLARTPVRFLGGASYAIYLLHMPLLTYFQAAVRRFQGADSPVTFLAYLTVVITVSSLVFHYYEEPLRRAIRSRFSGRRAVAAPPPSPPVPPPDRSISPPA